MLFKVKTSVNHIEEKSKNYDIYVGKPRNYLGQSIDQGKAWISHIFYFPLPSILWPKYVFSLTDWKPFSFHSRDTILIGCNRVIDIDVSKNSKQPIAFPFPSEQQEPQQLQPQQQQPINEKDWEILFFQKISFQWLI